MHTDTMAALLAELRKYGALVTRVRTAVMEDDRCPAAVCRMAGPEKCAECENQRRGAREVAA